MHGGKAEGKIIKPRMSSRFNIDITPFMRATLSTVISYFHCEQMDDLNPTLSGPNCPPVYGPVLTLNRQLKRSTEGLRTAPLIYYNCNESDFLREIGYA